MTVICVLYICLFCIMSVQVCVDWSSVVLRFTTAFDKVYCASKKAHFDCLPEAYKVVDGARIKWCNLLLLDAIIYYCNAQDFNFISRRAFNQQQELFEAILGSMKTFAAPGVSLSHSNVEVVFEPVLTFPWQSIDSLKFCMTQFPPCKSKLKYLTSVDLLCSHPTLTSAPLCDVLMMTVHSALQAMPQYQQQHLLQSTRPTFKLPEDKLASFRHLPRPPIRSCEVSCRTMESSHISANPTVAASDHAGYSRCKRSFSEDSYTDSHPPSKKLNSTVSNGTVSSIGSSCHQFTPQFFDQVFQDLNSSYTTIAATGTLVSNTGYISSSSSTVSGSSSLPSFWQTSAQSDVSTSSISDESHPLLGNISFDSMDSIESLNEAINLLNGY